MTAADETGRRSAWAPAGLERIFASRPGAPDWVESLAALVFAPTLDVDARGIG